MVQTLSSAQAARHAEMLTNRVRKNLGRVRRGFAREGIEAFRVYDWDIPEVRAVVDYYAGHLVVSELERQQTAGTDYLTQLVAGLTDGLQLPAGHVVGRSRRTRPRDGGARYGKQDARGERLVVSEGPLRFLVNLHDYLDTGLFADHRRLRARVRKQARGKRVLNLYAYTGSFSVAALSGGADEVVSVDLSQTYLQWACDNVVENGLDGTRHHTERGETRAFLRDAAARGERWDLIVLDPPSYSTVGGPGGLDVLRDHPMLLRETLACLAPGGLLYFSTNHQRFAPRFAELPAEIEEISEEVQPREYRRPPHRTFLLRSP